MSTCSLQQIFEKSLPENPNLSWKPMKHSPSFTEIFGELHFNESPQPSPSSSPHVASSSSSPHVASSSSSPFSDNNITTNQTPSPPITPKKVFSSLNLENLQICTDRSLGFESFHEVDQELKIEEEEEKESGCDGRGLWKSNRSSSSTREREYPPPISCIGRSGRPCVSFKCYRNNGRFVLKEIRIPTQDFLHASREDGRLKLHFVQHEEEEDFLGESDQEEDVEEKEEEGEEEDYNSLESTEENHGSNVTDQESKENRD